MTRPTARQNFSSPTFVAIDFETADNGRDSACSVAVVRVERNRIVARAHTLIRPPRREFIHTGIHGISREMVAESPTFRHAWPSIRSVLDGAEFIAAHNASFDRSVLRACCERANLRAPEHPFHCTVKIARSMWGLYPATLPDVCEKLRVRLRHHDAVSDAKACARIVIAAMKEGWSPS